MFDAEMVIRGTSRGLRESKNDRGRVIGHTVQLVKRSANGAVEVLPVRLWDGADPAPFAEGKHVELVVDVSSYEGTLYYRAMQPSKPDSARPSVKSPVSQGA